MFQHAAFPCNSLKVEIRGEVRCVNFGSSFGGQNTKHFVVGTVFLTRKLEKLILCYFEIKWLIYLLKSKVLWYEEV